jgi:hypothetical protein
MGTGVPGFICKPVNSTKPRYVCRHENNEHRRSNSDMRVVEFTTSILLY